MLGSRVRARSVCPVGSLSRTHCHASRVLSLNVILLVNEHDCWMCMLIDMSMVRYG